MGSGVLMGMAVSSCRSFHPAELCGLHPGFFLLLPTSPITKWCLCCALCSLVGSSGSSSVAARSQLTQAPSLMFRVGNVFLRRKLFPAQGLF